MLRHYVSPTLTDWDELLTLVEFAINNSYHESIKTTPFLLTKGRQVLTPMDDAIHKGTGRVVQDQSVPSAVKFTHDMQLRLQSARSCLLAAQQRQKHYADSGRSSTVFSIGDQVLLSTANMNFKGDLTKKLMPRFVGPFTVVDIINQVAVRLELPATMPIHPVFHVSLLKHYHPGGRVQPPPPTVLVEGEEEYVVQSILAHRLVKRGRSVKTQFLVRWQGCAPEHDTWEPESNLTNCPDVIKAYWQSVERNAAPTITGNKRKMATADAPIKSIRRRR
jgi:hypothetical protein